MTQIEEFPYWFAPYHFDRRALSVDGPARQAAFETPSTVVQTTFRQQRLPVLDRIRRAVTSFMEETQLNASSRIEQHQAISVLSCPERAALTVSGDARHLLNRAGAKLTALLILAMSVTGCASFHDNHYMASSVPPILAATPISNPQVLNFAELTGTPSNNQVIGKLDVLEVNTLPSLNSREAFKYTVRVGEDGLANIQEAGGPVRLLGRTLAEAEAMITQLSIDRGLYRTPHITVTMKERKVNSIFVSGAVKQPGWKQIPAADCNLISAIFYAGGLAPDAGTSIDIQNVMTRDELLNESIAATSPDGIAQTGYSQLREPRRASVDLISATKEGRDAYYIADGGAVHVERRSPDAIYVDGLVKRSGRQTFPLDDEEFRLLEAISAAGGTSSQVADKVYVVRAAQGLEKPAVIQASLKKARHDEAHNLMLSPGDFVSVEHTPATIAMEALQMIRVGASLNPLIP
ncbi:MAG: polysaccharide biosynthesis/export family protein [Planctomycetota bacterium]